MEKQTPPTFSEADFTDPIEITPADRQKWNKQGQRFNLLCATVIIFLCGLSWAYDHYAELRYFKPGVALFNQQHYPAAERNLRAYLRFDNDPDGHYYLGRTLLAEGKAAEARRELIQDGTRISPGRWSGGWRQNSRSVPYLKQLPH